MSQTKSLFKSTKESPYHLSVGAVLFNENKEIACHYFKELQFIDDNKKRDDFYILMRETVEVRESLEDVVLRGVQEEFGSTGEIERFLGSLKTKFPRGDVWVEKTTAYFLIKLKDFDPDYERDSRDDESKSVIQWQTIDFLITKMEEQGRKYKRTDLDESEILKRAKQYLS